MSSKDEVVDVLEPPMFRPSGKTTTREQAYAGGNWIGTFNLWIVRQEPEPALIYQQRGWDMSWAPGLLDLAAGGHYQAGETLADGLREAEEELGKSYQPESLVNLGRRLFVGLDSKHREKRNVSDLYLVEDNAPLASYQLQAEEVEAICACPVSELLKAHRNPSYQFTVPALKHDGSNTTLKVSAKSFPENYDNYHYKMALLADRYCRGEQDILY
jgi:8-oxo-dGTP pyrophosphatase MutT (NUDIX family)